MAAFPALMPQRHFRFDRTYQICTKVEHLAPIYMASTDTNILLIFKNFILSLCLDSILGKILQRLCCHMT